MTDRAMAPLALVRDTAKLNLRWAVRHGLPLITISRAARRGIPAARLVVETSGTTIDELVPLLDELRAAGPSVRGPVSTVTVRHAAVREVLSHPDMSSDFFGRIPGVLGQVLRWSATGYASPVVAPSLLAVDGPDHARYRKLVTRVFSAAAVERLRERTQRVADELHDDLEQRAAQGAPIDLVEHYCAELPVRMICEILGVPLSEKDTVLRLGGAAGPSLDLGLSWRANLAVERALSEFDAWLAEHLDYLRHHPGDNLLSKLVAARDDDEIGLTERELRSIAGLVLAAGFETTVNLLSNGISLLCRHPEQLGVLRDQPELWSNAVDEVLRFDPPVLLTARVAQRDLIIDGADVPAGMAVVAVLAGANRDPDVFAQPDVFDVARENARDHIAFSSGRHYCLGAALARMEGEIGLRSIFDRFPDLALAAGAERRPTRILRGFETLPAVVTLP